MFASARYASIISNALLSGKGSTRTCERRGVSAPRVMPADLSKHLSAELVDSQVVRQHLRMEFDAPGFLAG